MSIRALRVGIGCILSAPLLGIAPLVLRAQTGEGEGCYDLDIGEWSRSVGHDTLSYSPPPRIRLDTLSAEHVPAQELWYRVVPAPRSPPSIHRFAAWRPVGVDTVVIGWSTGFGGLSARLVRRDDVLRGLARTYTDVVPHEPHTAEMVARPVDCGAPIPPEHASWRRFPQRVALETGDTLALGERLPRDDLALEHYRSNTYWVRHRPVGIFSGATHARLGMDREGIVRKIEVFFDPEADFHALERRLADALGPPVSRQASDERVSVYWSGREEKAFNLYRFTTTRGEERVVIHLSRW